MQMSETVSPEAVWTILDGLHEGVIIIERDGSILHINQSARNLLLLDDSPIGKNLQNLLPDSIKFENLLIPPFSLSVNHLGNEFTITSSPLYTDSFSILQLSLRIETGRPTLNSETIGQLSAFTQISLESNFDKKLTAIVDGLKALGWNDVVLTLRNETFFPTKTISSQKRHGDSKLPICRRFPNTFWLELFTNEALSQFKHSNCYFVPYETEWLQQYYATLDEDFDHSPHFAGGHQWHANDIFCTLLTDREQHKIGLICFSNPVNGQRPNQAMFQAIGIYAQFTAALIENALLVEDAIARKSELEILFETSQALSSTLDRHEVLTILGQYMLQSVDGDGYTIYHWDERSQTLGIMQEFAKKAIGEVPSLLNTAVPLSPKSKVLEIINQKNSKIVDLNQVTSLPNPQWINDIEHFQCALLPLVKSDELYGLIQIFKRKDQRTLEDYDLQLLTAIGNQASTALETALIFEDTYEREQFYNALGNVNLAINFTLNKARALDLICSEALHIFNVDGAYIWEIENDILVSSAAKGHAAKQFLESKKLQPKPESFVHGLLKRSDPYYINEVQSQDSLIIHLPDAADIQSILGIPLGHEGRIIGLLILTDLNQPHRFTDKAASWASLYGIQVSIALQNANLIDELRKFNEQLDSRVAERTQELNQQNTRVNILLRITSQLSRSLDQDRVMTKALALVNEVANAMQGIIMLINQATGELMLRASLGASESPMTKQGEPTGLMRNEGLAGWVIDNRSAVIVHDVKEDPRWLELSKSSTHRSVLGVPLISNEDVIGVMMLFHAETAAFTLEQLDLVEAAAIQVSNAINNASLYHLISEQAERLGQALRNEIIQKANIEAVLESMADGVLVADEQNHIDMVNLSASNILGIPRDQLNGRSINEFLGLFGNFELSWLGIIEEWAKNSDRIQAGTLLTDELHIEDRVINVKLSPVISDKLFYGTVSIFRDITKEVEVEKLKNEFVSTVSHELRTPMTSIKGYADLMLMGAAGEMTPPQTQYLKVIKSNAERLHMLVNDLLDISRIETGKTTLDLRPLDIPQLIDKVVNDHLNGRIHQEGKELKVVKSFDESLPLVNADQRRVAQILTNLIDNAFNYTETGGIITITAHANGQHVYIQVKDNGIGISEDNLSKIFDRFFRSESDLVQKVSGTGLGLAIVHSLVTMHGGQLSVESTIGEGSTFTFNLPVVVEDGDPASIN